MKDLKKRAQAGDPQAQFDLALHYHDYGKLPFNEKLHFKWLNQACRNGNIEALNNLSDCYAKGIGTKKDKVKALNCLKKLSSLGNPMGQYNLARSYYRGDIVPKNYAKALYWFRIAAKKDDDAKIQVASFYILAQVVRRDYTKALKLLTSVSEDSFGEAALYLAFIYRHSKKHKDLNLYRMHRLRAQEFLDNFSALVPKSKWWVKRGI